MPFYVSNDDYQGFQADSWAQGAQGKVADQWAASAVADAPDRAAAAEQQAAQQQAAAQAQAAAEAQRQADEAAKQQADAAAAAQVQKQQADTWAANQWAAKSYDQAATAATGVAPVPASPSAPAPQPAPQGDVNGGATQTAAAVGPSTPLPSSGNANYVAAAWDAAVRNNFDPNIFVRQIQQESGFQPFNPDGSPKTSPAGAVGIAQIVPKFHPNVDPTNPLASLDYAAKLMASLLKQNGGDYSRALAAYNAGQGNVDKFGGVPPFAETQSYVKIILGDAAGLGAQLAQKAQEGLGAAGQAVQDAGTGAARVVQGAVNTVIENLRPSQFAVGLDSASAYAACGPVAAIAFARAMGRNPTAQEAVQLARQVGWTAAQGMAGPGSELSLLTSMGVPAHMENGADANKMATDVGNGNPVIISTPGHYFVADGYDAKTGAFHVGTSGTDLRRGSEWMTLGQMQNVMGNVQATLYLDRQPGDGPSIAAQMRGQQPGTSTAQPAQPRAQSMAQFIQQHQAAGQGMPTDTELGNFVLSQPADQTAASVGTPQPIQQPTSPFAVVSRMASGVGDAVSGAVSGATGAVAGLFGRGGPGGQQPTDSTPAATTSPFPGLPSLPTGMPPEGGGYGAGGPLLPGEAASAFAPVGQAAADLAANPLLPTNLTNAGLQAAGQVIAPFFANPLDAAQTYTEIQRRYGGGIDPATGRFRAPDFSNITPEDEQALANATMAVGGVATPPGEGGSESIRAMTGGVSDRIPGILGGTGGIVADSPAIRQVVENAAPVSANADRFYHGTGSDFPRPDAARFEPNGLFGPGYYLTSDPRVAGGDVALGGEIAREGKTFSSASQRGPDGRLMPVDTTYRQPGEVISSGYAQQRDVDPVALAEADRLERALQNATPQYRADNEGWMQDQIDRLRNYGTGPNVRAVDVPKGLNLLNADAPISADESAQIVQAAGLRNVPSDWFNGVTGTEVRDSLVAAAKANNVAQPEAEASRMLADAGYDGIQYAGGKRIPMADQAGVPIEHTVVVVFPESLDKLTNATAGTRGGLLPDLAGESAVGRIAGRAAMGGISAGAQQAQQPGATPQDIALAALQGATLGAGREALLRNLPAGARLSATLARAVEDQGGVRPPQDLSQAPTILERFGLTDRPVEGATPLSDDALLSHYQGLEQQYEANNVQIARLADQLHEARNPGVAPIRPQWAVGLPNEALIKIANDHGVSPYREDWWEEAGLSTGSGELSRLLREGGIRGVGTQRFGGSQLQNAQAELDRLRAENQAITDHLDPLTAAEPGTLYRAPAQPAELPFAPPTDVVQSASREPATATGAPAISPPTPVGGSEAIAPTTPADLGVREGAPRVGTEVPTAAPVSDTAGGNLPVEQIPEVQRVREVANPPPQVNPADNGIPPPPGEPPRPVSTNPDDFDANVRAAVEQEAKKPGSFWQVLNAYHSGNVVMGPFTLGKVAANTMFQPTWNLGTQTARDLLTLNIDRAMGRSVGAGQALWSIGNDFMDGFGQAMAGRTTSSIPMVDHFLQAQHAVGGALHAGMQNVAAEAVRRMELGAAAGEQVAAQGGRGIEGIGKIADLVRDSSSLPDEAVFRAADMADRAGLRSPAGAVQQTVQSMLNQAANTPVGAVTNFLLPVFRIGAQGTARLVEASPVGLVGTGIDVARGAAGFGPYAKGFSQYGQAVTPLAERLTANIAGTAITAFLASKSLDGTITGTGPDDPHARANLEAQGWRPKSVLVPGVGYVSWERLPEQLKGPLMIAGAYGDAVREHPDDPQGVAGRLAQEVATMFAQGAPGLSTLADIGGILKGDPNAIGYLVGGSAAGYIPGSAILGNVATAMDPLARKIPTTQGFEQAILGNVQQSIPGLREQLQARTSVLGQPMPNPAAGLQGLLPWRTPGEIAPGTPGLQALKVLNANGVTLGAAPKTVTLGNGSRVDLTDDEQQQYEADRAVLLDQMTSGLAGNQQFAAAPGAARKQVLDRLIRQADTVAGRQMVGTIAQGGDFASRLQGPKRLEEPVPAIRPPLALTELNSAQVPAQATRGSTLPLTSDLATLDPAQQEQLRRQLAATP